MNPNEGHKNREQYLKEATKSIDKTCEYCGKPMYRKIFLSGRKEEFSAFLKRKYCNRECMKRAFVVQGENTEQAWGTAHHSARNIMRLISSKECKCEKCGTTKNVDIHHVDGNPQNNTIENLMYLCRSCHMKVHHKKTVCIICGKPIVGHGYCNKHYLRWRKYGDPQMCYNKISKT